jgi:cell division protein FtsB
MSEARTTTVKRTPRRASDAGRSRLGDLTRPIAREQRISRDRRPTVLFALGALVIAGAIAGALFLLPVRTWFEQDDRLAERRQQLDELEAVNADQQAEVERLLTPDGVREAAREELGFIDAGESRLSLLGLPDLPRHLPDGWPYSAVSRIIAVRTGR